MFWVTTKAKHEIHCWPNSSLTARKVSGDKTIIEIGEPGGGQSISFRMRAVPGTSCAVTWKLSSFPPRLLKVVPVFERSKFRRAYFIVKLQREGVSNKIDNKRNEKETLTREHY